jgi:hypothetical protein
MLAIILLGQYEEESRREKRICVGVSLFALDPVYDFIPDLIAMSVIR